MHNLSIFGTLSDAGKLTIFIATQYNTKIILVADIEKGGVFASIWGVYNP